MKMRVGTKVKFKGEKQAYTVQASNAVYAVLTKPFNPKHTVLYTIISFLENIRGPEDLIFGMGAETREQCEQMLTRLTEEGTRVSRRHFLPLDIEWVKNRKDTEG